MKQFLAISHCWLICLYSGCFLYYHVALLHPSFYLGLFEEVAKLLWISHFEIRYPCGLLNSALDHISQECRPYNCMEVLFGEAQLETMKFHYPTDSTTFQLAPLITGDYSSWPRLQENENENWSGNTLSSQKTSTNQEDQQSTAIKDAGKRDFHTLLVGLYVSKIIIDNRMGVPQGTTSKITTHSYLLIKIDAWPLGSVLPLFLFLWLNAQEKINLWEEKVYWSFNFSSESVIVGKSRQELEAASHIHRLEQRVRMPLLLTSLSLLQYSLGPKPKDWWSQEWWFWWSHIL